MIIECVKMQPTICMLSHTRYCNLQCTCKGNLYACRHTKQTDVPSAAPQNGDPSTAASDSRDQESGQAPSAAAPANLQVSKTEAQAAVEAPAQVSKEDRIAAAREKYLARKRQKTG